MSHLNVSYWGIILAYIDYTMKYQKDVPLPQKCQQNVPEGNCYKTKNNSRNHMNWIKVSLIGKLVYLGTTYHLYRISGVMGGMHASSVVDHGFEPLSGQAKDCDIVCC